MNTSELDITQWIRVAQMDFDSALTLSKVQYPTPLEIICYHCQQSVEKILKAYFIAKENRLTKTHELDDLIEKCKKYSFDFDKFKSFCAKLTLYTTTTRYPPIIDLTEQDMKYALKGAREILNFTKSKLKDLGYEYNPPDPK
jgi:HEPN domain-containing protein